MGRERTTSRGPITDAPERGIAVPDPPANYEPSHVVQALIDIQKDLSATSTKVDRLISDVAAMDSKVDTLQGSLSWAKGFGVAATILIPMCAGIIWWLIGGELAEIKSQVLDQAPVAAEPPTNPG